MNSQADPDRQRSLPAAPKLRKPAKKKVAEPVEQKKKGRGWRDYVLWAVLVLLAVGATAEFRAQAAYSKTLAVCNAALERTEAGKGAGGDKRVTFDELKDKLPADPVYTEGKHDFAKAGIYTWTWQGVRRYKVHLYVDPKTKTISGVGSEPSADGD